MLDGFWTAPKSDESIKNNIFLEMKHLKAIYKMESVGVPYDLEIANGLLKEWYEYKINIEEKCHRFLGVSSDPERKIVAKNPYNLENLKNFEFKYPINLDNNVTIQHIIYATGFEPGKNPNLTSTSTPTKKRKTSCEICRHSTCQIIPFSTSAENLEKLLELNQNDPSCKKVTKMAVEKIIHYRKLKRRIDELENLKGFLDEKTGRIPYTTSFTETGRIQMENPSLLTISNSFTLSVSGQEKEISPRLAFSVKNRSNGRYKLLSVDFKQIEQRVIAHLSNDKLLIQYLSDEENDFFTTTAKKILGTSEASERKKIKAMVYGLNYGMGNKSLAGRLGVSVDEATKIKDAYFGLFGAMNEFRESMKEKTQITSLLKRTKKYPENVEFDPLNKNVILRSGKQFTIIIASIVQSCASDIVRLLTLSCDKLVDEGIFQKYETKLVLQIHDELLIEIREELVEKFVDRLKYYVKESFKRYLPGLRIDFPVRAKVGDSYGSLEDF